MSEITSRAAYLKGLADGLKLNKETAEGQLIDGILELLCDMAEEMDMIDQEQGFIADEIDGIGNAVEVLGNEVFGIGYEEDMYTLACENCGAEIDLTDADLDDVADGVFKCPDCGEVIELNLDDCGCGCDCGHEH